MSSIDKFIYKRDGRSEPVDFNKISIRLRKLCMGFNRQLIDVTKITNAMKDGIVNNMTTRQLDHHSAAIAHSMIKEHYYYSWLGGRVVASDIQKSTYASFSEAMDCLYNYVNPLAKPNKQRKGVKLRKSVYNFIKRHKERLNNMIMPERDFMFDYFAMDTMSTGGYLMKIGDQVIETPQYAMMRITCDFYSSSDDIEGAAESYKRLSLGHISAASPLWFNAGTLHNTMPSCFLLSMEDSLHNILRTVCMDVGMIAKGSGGIGIDFSSIRSRGQLISTTGGHSEGTYDAMATLQSISKYVNQGGRRPGSVACYMEVWHPEIVNFVKLRRETGSDEERLRKLFYAVYVNTLFMVRVANDLDWTLVSPDECPELHLTYGLEFVQHYLKMEANPHLTSKQVIKARKLFYEICTTQIETGMPYMANKDCICGRNNQENLGPIRLSNLCCEITQYTDKDQIATCILSSVALPACCKWNDIAGKYEFDHKELYDITAVAVDNLNHMIDCSKYPRKRAKYAAQLSRSVGIGVQGLANAFQMLRLPFESDAARTLNKEIFETMAFASTERSMQWAKKVGKPYPSYEGSPISKGMFQHDLAYREMSEFYKLVHEICTGHPEWITPLEKVGFIAPNKADYQPSARWDWEGLRQNVKQYGTYNAHLLAVMPTASSAIILGNSECIEPFAANIYNRSTKCGERSVINRNMVDDLTKLNLWTPAIQNQLLADGGSIQNIKEIPQEIRELYKIAIEIKPRAAINLAGDRQIYICQSQSFNIFLKDADYVKLSAIHMNTFFKDKHVKTMMYYLKSRPSNTQTQINIDPSRILMAQQQAQTNDPVPVVVGIKQESNGEPELPSCSLHGCGG